LFSAVLAKHAGAGLLIVSEPRAGRRELARQMGADIVVNPREENLHDVVMHHTGGRGVEISIEAVGLEPALSQAIEVVAIGGTVLWGGVAPADLRVPVSPNEMFMKEYTLRTSWGGLLEYDRTLRLEQVIDWSPVIEEVFPLDQAMEAVNYARTQAAGKVLLRTSR
jgi:threonine dehydrogenase-like Zn-dependent dehydrogenase